jgi:Amidase
MLNSAAGDSISQAGSTTSGLADIVMMDGASLENAIRSRRVSCVEVMNAYLHIENLNPKVNAIVALEDRPALLAQARERDAQLARGESMGPLHGFPHAVKDLQPVKGIRSTSGSPILKDFVPTADSLMVERLRKAGAIVIGKTNIPSSVWDHTPTIRSTARHATPMTNRVQPAAAAAAPLSRSLFVCCPLQTVPIMEGACAIRLAGTMFWVSVRAMAGFQGMRPTSGCRR